MTDAFAVCGVIGHGNSATTRSAVDVEKGARRGRDDRRRSSGAALEQAAEAIIQSRGLRHVPRGRQAGLAPAASIRATSRSGVRRRGPDAGLLPGPRARACSEVWCPTAPGVLSALGGLIADIKNDFISTVYYSISAARAAAPEGDFDRPRAPRAPPGCRRAGICRPATFQPGPPTCATRANPSRSRWCSSWTGSRRATSARIAAAFHAQHERLYGQARRHGAGQIVSLRLVVLGTAPKPSSRAADGASRRARAGEADRGVPRRRLSATCRSIARADSGARASSSPAPASWRRSDCTTCVPDGLHRRGRRLRQHPPVARASEGSTAMAIDQVTLQIFANHARRPPRAWRSRCSARRTRPSSRRPRTSPPASPRPTA